MGQRLDILLRVGADMNAPWIRFTFRGYTRHIRELKNEAFLRGLTMTYDFDRGLFANTYRVEISGPQKTVDEMKEWVEKWSKENLT